ncbi:hypothetical protein Tco_1474987 [Tanacetum coccineum]
MELIQSRHELWKLLIKDFKREDLIELYRLVMQKYGTNRPEDAYDRVLWSDLRTMFDPPLIEDAIWSLPLQQKMLGIRKVMKLSVEKWACFGNCGLLWEWRQGNEVG